MRYRDTKTGKLVSQSTWKRSKAQGGTRFKREAPKRPKKLKRLPEPRLIRPKKAKLKKKKKTAARFEYVLKLSYHKRRNHGIDVEVHLIGPRASKDDIKEVYEEWFTTGDTPQGWEVYAITWRGSNKRWSRTFETETIRERLWFVLSQKIDEVTTKGNAKSVELD